MVLALVIASSVPKITCESLMADCTGLVQKILSHLRKEFYVQICPLKVGATGPHKLGNLSIWDEMSKDGKDHRRTARRNIWNIINPCKGMLIHEANVPPPPHSYYYYSTRCISTHATSPNVLCYSLFSVILVFVFSHVFVIVFVFIIFTLTFMTFSQSFLWHPRIPARSTASDVKKHRRWSSSSSSGGKGGGHFL